MARYIGPVCRQCRREGMKLFLKGERCHTEKCAIEKRNFPPGQHGKDRKPKIVGYGLQLREKQKARRYYQLLEGQFRNLFEKASGMKGITGLKTGVNKSVIGAPGGFRASPDSLCSVACVPGRVIIRRSCPLFPPSCRDVPLGKRCAPMSGGRSLCWCFLALAHSLFIRPGRHSKEPIIFLVTTSRHFIHRKSLAIRPIAGLGQNRTGGRTGFYFRPRS